MHRLRARLLGWLAVLLASPSFAANVATQELRPIWQGPVGAAVPGQPLLLDVNDDGVDDLVWADATTETRSLHVNDGRSGVELWKTRIPDSQLRRPLWYVLDGAPVLLLRGDFQGPVAIRARDGQVVWSAARNNDFHEGSLSPVTMIADQTGDRVAEVLAIWQAFRPQPLTCPLYGDTAARAVVMSGRSGRVIRAQRLPDSDALMRYAAFRTGNGVAVYRLSGFCQVERAPRVERWHLAGTGALARDWILPVRGIPYVREAEGRTFVADESGGLSVLEAETGEVVWTRQWNDLEFVAAPELTASVRRHRLVVTGNQRDTGQTVVLLLDPESGKLLQQIARGGHTFWEAGARIVELSDGDWLQFSVHEEYERGRLPESATWYAVDLDSGREVRLHRPGTAPARAVMTDLDHNGYPDILWPHSGGIERFELNIPFPNALVYR